MNEDIIEEIGSNSLLVLGVTLFGLYMYVGAFVWNGLEIVYYETALAMGEVMLMCMHIYLIAMVLKVYRFFWRRGLNE